MSAHDHLLTEYRPSIGENLTYPVSATMPNVENWNLLSAGEIVPTDKALWAAAYGTKPDKLTADEKEEAYKTYMKNFVEEYGAFRRPFQRATMMVLPKAWSTGYNKTTAEGLTALATMQGEATKIKDAIGVVNNTISRIEGLLYSTQSQLTQKRRLRKNMAYVDLANREAPMELSTLDSDIITLEGLELGYGEQLAVLRKDARVLNMELGSLLESYKAEANRLGIADNFAKELDKSYGSGKLRGIFYGGFGGIAAAGLGLFLLVQARRAPQRVRSTRRGADGLFLRAP